MISSSHGRPRAIQKKDFDVRHLTTEDFPDDDEDARLFIAYVEIYSILGDLTENSVRGTLGRSSRMLIEDRLFRWMYNLPEEFHIHDRKTRQLCPYNSKARQLHVPYFTVLSILFRPTVVDTPPSVATVLSSSFVVGICEDFLARGEIPVLGPVFIFHLLAAALAELSCHNYPVLWEKTERELEVLNQALKEFAHKFPSAVGGQRVIKAVTSAVQKQQAQRKSYQSAVAPEQFKFFTFFGPDLCSKWELIYGRKAETEPRTIPNDGLLVPSISQNQDSLDRDNAAGEQQSPDQFAVEGLMSLHDPKNLSTVVPPNTIPVTRPAPANIDGIGGIIETGSATTTSNPIDQPLLPFATDSLVDPVGNWMVNDWMTDLNYWDSLVGE